MEKMRNPDGEYRPMFQALNEWGLLFEPMQSLGFVVHSYDPGISFRSKECVGHHAIFTISCSDLKIINDAITR
jgi:hypothetical protein